ncbi:MAG: isochorismatase family protein [Planctomycetaceae bacterium]
MNSNQADDFQLTLRSQSLRSGSASEYERTESKSSWKPSETAIIVCDVWDRHHCLNAVRRMTEFLPRMDALLKKARAEGALIIHSPSDCMPSYEGHPARLRATKVPVSPALPPDAAFWCSQIPSEEQALYPIDQSDGGEDDDPAEHREWATKLISERRNPGLPWKTQNEAITIDSDKDYISDRGDEVFNILEARGIRNVILVGVHTNMCVLGRPFGLRQMVRSGRNVVLARDLTDCMYNPARWPYVDHFTGNDLIVSHVERFVCPTITSDQILGGTAHVSKYDKRTQRDIMQVDVPRFTSKTAGSQWSTVVVPASFSELSSGTLRETADPVWYRCTLRLTSDFAGDKPLVIKLPGADPAVAGAWLNGTPLVGSVSGNTQTLTIPADSVVLNDINLLVLKTDPATAATRTIDAPEVVSGERSMPLKGRWQIRIGEDESWFNIPLPAKFGIGSDVLFE